MSEGQREREREMTGNIYQTSEAVVNSPVIKHSGAMDRTGRTLPPSILKDLLIFRARPKSAILIHNPAPTAYK